MAVGTKRWGTFCAAGGMFLARCNRSHVLLGIGDGSEADEERTNYHTENRIACSLSPSQRVPRRTTSTKKGVLQAQRPLNYVQNVVSRRKKKVRGVFPGDRRDRGKNSTRTDDHDFPG